MKRTWWHDKVAYQIYPKSFYDTNDDGIGDIRGIIEKLDYLKMLGIDIIWVSPIYQSPFVDQGYDISDYYAIDPAFGTMNDLEELLEETKKRDMYLIMDLVVNHCSNQHEWFQKALKDPEASISSKCSTIFSYLFRIYSLSSLLISSSSSKKSCICSSISIPSWNSIRNSILKICSLNSLLLTCLPLASSSFPIQ